MSRNSALALLIGIAIGLGAPTFAQHTHGRPVDNAPTRYDRLRERLAQVTDQLATCQATPETPAAKVKQRIETETLTWLRQ